MLAWCGSPSSMKTYLLGTHQINKAIAMKYQEEELKDLMQSDDIKPHDFAKQESLTKNVMSFIIGTVQPLSILEDPDFINMVNRFDERYKVPCTKTLKDRIFTVYEAGKDTLKSQFMQIQHISLTLDAWSSPAHLPYLGITHTGFHQNLNHKKYFLVWKNCHIHIVHLKYKIIYLIYFMNGKLIQKSLLL